MTEFLKNYLLGIALTVWYLPKFLAGVLLILIPSGAVAYGLSSILPDIFASVAGVMVALYVGDKLFGSQNGD